MVDLLLVRILAFSRLGAGLILALLGIRSRCGLPSESESDGKGRLCALLASVISESCGSVGFWFSVVGSPGLESSLLVFAAAPLASPVAAGSTFGSVSLAGLVDSSVLLSARFSCCCSVLCGSSCCRVAQSKERWPFWPHVLQITSGHLLLECPRA